MNTLSRLRRVESRAASNKLDFGVSLIELTDEGYQLTVDFCKPGGSWKRMVQIPAKRREDSEMSGVVIPK